MAIKTVGGVNTAHNALSARHGDSTAAAVVRGDVITGQGATPKWTRLAIGTQYHVLQAGASEPAYGLITNNNVDASAAIAVTKLAQVSDHITIHPINYSGVTAGTWIWNVDATCLGCGYLNNGTTHANNDRVDYTFSCSGGTYTFRFVMLKGGASGIADFLVDGTSIGTYDLNGSGSVNINTITGVALTAGSHTVSFKANGSTSGDYYISLSLIGLWRTGT